MTSTAVPRPPPPSHILETCLYVRDMNKSSCFYKDILGLEPQIKSSRLIMFPLGDTTLLLFQLGMTSADIQSERGVVPGHGPDERVVENISEPNHSGAGWLANLRTHYCLAVSSREEVDRWERYLKSKSVVMRGTMDWEKGGKSVYFEDPDGHVGEIGSRGIWEHW